ncbi:MAG: aminoglycoside phosphotransferase family protein [Lachnospiraceae bacterium]|nr:aminoglycoside phosphotransferase family protein [Lachnospiraceae bacterium]
MNQIAKGNTAEVYEYGDGLICKLFYSGYPDDYVKHDFYNATVLEKSGVRTPKAYKIITENGREGIVYDRIAGEELYHKFNEKNEISYDVWIDRFAEFHKQLLQCRVDDVMSYKDFLKMFATDKETIAKIELLPDDNCLIHGDFHLGNVLVDKDDNLVLIDMMNVCKGPALYDVARTYFLLGNDTVIQSKYIERMGYTLEDIMPYLDVILAVRDKEMAR